MDVESMLEAPLAEKKGQDFLNSLDLEKEKNGADRSRDDSPRSVTSRPSRRQRSRSRDSYRSRSSRRSPSPRRGSPRREDRRSSHYDDRESDRRRRSSRSPPYERRRRDYGYDQRDRRSHRDSRRRSPSPRDRRGNSRRSPSPRSRRRDDSPRANRGPPREPSPKLTEEEHEMRSVFVSQLSARVGDRELKQFFEAQAGPVRDAKVIMDRISRRSKGVGYIEFKELETVQKALNLSGTRLLGLPIMVQYTEAERNRQASSSTPATLDTNITIPAGSDASPHAPIPYNRLYVGSLNFSLTGQDLRQVFQPFGPVELVDLHKDAATGKSKGYAFVQFRFHKDAMTAMEKMQNFVLAGRQIRVGLVTEKVQQMVQRDGGGGAYRSSDLDDPDKGGNLSGVSRVDLMHKLSRNDKSGNDAPQQAMWKPNIPTAATKCILLKNMFNAAEETDANWDTDLRDDVAMEVRDKYGEVDGIYVVKDSEGEIYIKFTDQESAQKALGGLNGRFFGGRTVQASFVSEAMYTAMKP